MFWYHMALAALLVATVGIAVGCEDDKIVTQKDLKTRIATTETQAAPKPSPRDEEPPAKREAQYYGSTYWDELLTSVYFYPSTGKDDAAMTHLKFNHREDDIWLCGALRRSFVAGERYRLLVTFEPNQPCVTNWKTK